MRKFFIALVFFVYSAKYVYAVSVSILDSPSSIGEDKFTVTVKTEGALAGTNYLKVDLYVDGSKNYFGETDNGQSWYAGVDGKQYFPITILSSTPNIATFSARLGEPSLADYPGPGIYKLRIRRYTSSGGQGSEDPIPANITITKTWPSPIPSPTPTPIPSPIPSPVTPSPTPIVTPTPKPSPKPSSTPAPSPDMSPSSSGSVAGVSTEINLAGFGLSPTPSPSLQGDSRKGPTLNPARAKIVIYVGSGLVLISIAGFLGYRKYLKSITI